MTTLELVLRTQVQQPYQWIIWAPGEDCSEQFILSNELDMHHESCVFAEALAEAELSRSSFGDSCEVGCAWRKGACKVFQECK